MNGHLFTTTLMLLALLITSGCATGPTPHDRARGVESVEAPPRSPRLSPGIYEVATGERITREELYARLAQHRFILVGESHDDAWHHEVQRDVYRGLTSSVGAEAKVLLGMEMVQRPYQEGLDRYTRGEIDQEAMLEAIDYRERWGFPVEFYSPLWKHARETESRVIALNARRELTRRCAKVGLEKLTEEERASLPAEMDLTNAAHRAWVKGIFEGHGMAMDDETFQKFYEAQVIWDETMAETAVKAMVEQPANARMLIVAGAGHVMNGWGIPSRIARRTGDTASVVTLLPVSPEKRGESLAEPGGATEADLAAWRAMKHADYVWVY